MNSRDPNKDFFGKSVIYLLLAFILVSIIVHFLWLDADPPVFFYGLGQDLLTDPYNVVHYARNKVLFGEWDIFNYQRWIVFQYSLSSMAAYLAFLIGGVSRISANLSAVILNLAGIFLFCLGLRKKSPKASFIALAILLANMPFLVYGRYPFLENGLIFLCGLLFWIYNSRFSLNVILPISGFLISLCVLSGKLFGIIMIFPVILTMMIVDRKSIYKRVGIVLLSFLVTFVLLAIIYYGHNYDKAYDYVIEQTIGLHGIPFSTLSVKEIFAKFITFGAGSRIFYFAPFLLVMSFLSAIVLVISGDVKNHLKSNKALLFNIVWLLGGAFLLMISDYRPLRYHLFLILPLAGIISGVFFDFPVKAVETGRKYVRIFLVAILSWYFCFQLAVSMAITTMKVLPEGYIVWLMLLPCALLTILIIKYGNAVIDLFYRKKIIFAVLVAFYMTYQSFWIADWYKTKSYCLKEAGEDLSQIVDNDAVIAGPFSSALTIDNDIRSFVYMFGLARKEQDLFDKYPITHIASDISNWEEATKDYPELAYSQKITHYWVRDIEISLIRINGFGAGDRHFKYELTDFERAAQFHGPTGFPDSVNFYLDRHRDQYPSGKSAAALLANYYMAQGMTRQGLETYEKLISSYPTDFSLYFRKAQAYYMLFLMSNNDYYRIQSEEYFIAAKKLNPYIDKDIAEAKKFAMDRQRQR